MEQGRLLLSGPADGATNMAVDQALLELAEEIGQTTLRFYEWVPATVSLGYFQSNRDREEHPSSYQLDWVRRTTGGGAIVHDRELTYSLVIPRQHRWSAENEQLYDSVHRALVQILADEYEITAHRFGDTVSSLTNPQNKPLPLSCGSAQDSAAPPVDSKTREPFLCFQRRSAGDVVIDSHKVLGSAQRRYRNSLLQHGSLLLSTSRFTPELPGISEITGKPLDIDRIRNLWLAAISQIMQIEFVEQTATKSDLASRIDHWRRFHLDDPWRYKR